MARTDQRFRLAYNELVERCGSVAPGTSLPSEATLARQLGVSRSIVRGVLGEMDGRGILRWRGRAKVLMRSLEPSDQLATREAGPSLQELERRFLDWILRFDVPADTALNVTKLARDFNVTPRLLQDLLAAWSRFGLVERRPRGGWRLQGFTADYAVELSDFRAILEIDAVRHLMALPSGHAIWPALEALRDEHLALLGRIETDFHDFSRLDERFHAAVSGVVGNRFVVEFRKVVSLIFHYHYQWDKTDERQRNEAAIGEHLRWIDAMLRRAGPEAEAAARIHLATSKLTLLSSLRSHNLA